MLVSVLRLRLLHLRHPFLSSFVHLLDSQLCRSLWYPRIRRAGLIDLSVSLAFQRSQGLLTAEAVYMQDIRKGDRDEKILDEAVEQAVQASRQRRALSRRRSCLLPRIEIDDRRQDPDTECAHEASSYRRECPSQ